MAAVVITTERTAAQSRGEVTKPVDATFGAFQAASTQRENNPAPSPAICPAIMLCVRALGASGFSTSSYAVGPRLAKISGLRGQRDCADKENKRTLSERGAEDVFAFGHLLKSLVISLA